MGIADWRRCNTMWLFKCDHNDDEEDDNNRDNEKDDGGGMTIITLRLSFTVASAQL